MGVFETSIQRHLDFLQKNLRVFGITGVTAERLNEILSKSSEPTVVANQIRNWMSQPAQFHTRLNRLEQDVLSRFATHGVTRKLTESAEWDAPFSGSSVFDFGRQARSRPVRKGFVGRLAGSPQDRPGLVGGEDFSPRLSVQPQPDELIKAVLDRQSLEGGAEFNYPSFSDSLDELVRAYHAPDGSPANMVRGGVLSDTYLFHPSELEAIRHGRPIVPHPTTVKRRRALMDAFSTMMPGQREALKGNDTIVLALETHLEHLSDALQRGEQLRFDYMYKIQELQSTIDSLTTAAGSRRTRAIELQQEQWNKLRATNPSYYQARRDLMEAQRVVAGRPSAEIPELRPDLPLEDETRNFYTKLADKIRRTEADQLLPGERPVTIPSWLGASGPDDVDRAIAVILGRASRQRRISRELQMAGTYRRLIGSGALSPTQGRSFIMSRGYGPFVGSNVRITNVFLDPARAGDLVDRNATRFPGVDIPRIPIRPSVELTADSLLSQSTLSQIRVSMPRALAQGYVGDTTPMLNILAAQRLRIGQGVNAFSVHKDHLDSALDEIAGNLTAQINSYFNEARESALAVMPEGEAKNALLASVNPWSLDDIEDQNLRTFVRRVLGTRGQKGSVFTAEQIAKEFSIGTMIDDATGRIPAYRGLAKNRIVYWQRLFTTSDDALSPLELQVKQSLLAAYPELGKANWSRIKRSAIAYRLRPALEAAGIDFPTARGLRYQVSELANTFGAEKRSFDMTSKVGAVDGALGGGGSPAARFGGRGGPVSAAVAMEEGRVTRDRLGRGMRSPSEFSTSFSAYIPAHGLDREFSPVEREVIGKLDALSRIEDLEAQLELAVDEENYWNNLKRTAKKTQTADEIREINRNARKATTRRKQLHRQLDLAEYGQPDSPEMQQARTALRGLQAQREAAVVRAALDPSPEANEAVSNLENEIARVYRALSVDVDRRWTGLDDVVSQVDYMARVRRGVAPFAHALGFSSETTDNVLASIMGQGMSGGQFNPFFGDREQVRRYLMNAWMAGQDISLSMPDKDFNIPIRINHVWDSGESNLGFRFTIQGTEADRVRAVKVLYEEELRSRALEEFRNRGIDDYTPEQLEARISQLASARVASGYGGDVLELRRRSLLTPRPDQVSMKQLRKRASELRIRNRTLMDKAQLYEALRAVGGLEGLHIPDFGTPGYEDFAARFLLDWANQNIYTEGGERKVFLPFVNTKGDYSLRSFSVPSRLIQRRGRRSQFEGVDLRFIRGLMGRDNQDRTGEGLLRGVQQAFQNLQGFGEFELTAPRSVQKVVSIAHLRGSVSALEMAASLPANSITRGRHERAVGVMRFLMTMGERRNDLGSDGMRAALQNFYRFMGVDGVEMEFGELGTVRKLLGDQFRGRHRMSLDALIAISEAFPDEGLEIDRGVALAKLAHPEVEKMGISVPWGKGPPRIYGPLSPFNMISVPNEIESPRATLLDLFTNAFLEGNPELRSSLDNMPDMAGSVDDLVSSVSDYTRRLIEDQALWDQLGSTQQGATVQRAILANLANLGYDEHSAPLHLGETLSVFDQVAEEAAASAGDAASRAAGRARATSAALPGAKTARAIFQDIRGLIREDRFVRYGAVAAGALVTAGLIRAAMKHNKQDRNPEELTGPPNLPGGNPYSGIVEPGIAYTATGLPGYPGQGAFSEGGVTYQINARGNYDPAVVQSQIEAITGTSPYGTISNGIPNQELDYDDVASEY